MRMLNQPSDTDFTTMTKKRDKSDLPPEEAQQAKWQAQADQNTARTNQQENNKIYDFIDVSSMQLIPRQN